MKISEWIGANADSYRRFFLQDEDVGGWRTLGGILREIHPNLEANVSEIGRKQWANPWHSQRSICAAVDILLEADECSYPVLSICVPWPSEEPPYLFEIDGRDYYTPMARLLLDRPSKSGRQIPGPGGGLWEIASNSNLESRSTEFRLSGHVLSDMLTRCRVPVARMASKGERRLISPFRKLLDEYTFGLYHYLPPLVSILAARIRELVTAEEESTLTEILRDSLWPLALLQGPLSLLKSCKAFAEPLFYPVPDNLNRVGRTAIATRLVTVRAMAIGRDHMSVPYTAASNTSYRDRATGQKGLCGVHTPEGERIGLTRHLALNSTVGSDRRLHQGDSTYGLMASLVPFSNYNDPRRLLMAAAELGQAVRPESPELPGVNGASDQLYQELASMGIRAELGRNLRVGFIYWKGLNFEDAIVVSESAAEKLGCIETRTVSLNVPTMCYEPDRTSKEDMVGPGEYVREGMFVLRGMPLARPLYSALDLRLVRQLRKIYEKDAELFRRIKRFQEEFEWVEQDYLCPFDGTVDTVRVVRFLPSDSDDDVPPWCACHWRCRIDVTIRRKHPLGLGDKLCNRHGNKGVVSSIVPDDEMPVAGGKSLEVLFSPIGVLNRNNFGQMQEARESDEYSSTALIGGREVKAVCGLNYIMRLPNHAIKAKKSVGKCRPSEVTGQAPSRLGQKITELALICLQAWGAEAVLRELFDKRSRDTRAPMRSRLHSWLAAGGLELHEDISGSITIRKHEGIPVKDKHWCFSKKCSHKREIVVAETKEERKRRRPRRAIDWLELIDDPASYRNLEGNAPKKEYTYYHAIADLPGAINTEGDIEDDYRLAILHPCLRKSFRNRLHPLTAHLRSIFREACDKEPDSERLRGRIDRYEMAVRKRLVPRLVRKHGIIKQLVMSRRLDYSARMVIIPDPSIRPDEVSLPLDVAVDLFEWVFEKELLSDVREGILRAEAQICAKEAPRRHPGERISAWLEEQSDLIQERISGRPILVNRNPSLHMYSIMSFEARVRPDLEPVMGISPMVVGPFGADFDGDTMSAFALKDEEAAKEARELMSLQANLRSYADGSPVPGLTKDIALGAYMDAGEQSEAKAHPQELREKIESLIDGEESGSVEVLFQMLRDSIRGLDGLEKHSFWESNPARLFGWYNILWDSGAAKSRSEEDDDLIRGGRDSRKKMIEDRIGLMARSKMAVGNFGGYAKRLYYGIDPGLAEGCGEPLTAGMRNSGGASSRESRKKNRLVFDDELQLALRSILTITERASQKALSTKSGEGALEFAEFQAAMNACISTGVNEGCEEGVLDELGFCDDELRRHIDNIRNAHIDMDSNRGTIGAFLGHLQHYLIAQQKAGFFEPCDISNRDPRTTLLLIAAPLE